MDNFIVSARKYRPVTFDSVVGQQHITNTLKNAIQHNQLAQAFLFCGPRGVGKTTCARILAKTINCENISDKVEACGECESCKSFQHGASFSIHELDAASNNSVDDIRNLIDQVRIPPQTGKYKIYIIDEVHMLSQAAFNAFLKTLEEPPAYAIFILATTEKHKILPTILSRCQIFDFNRIKVEDMANHLAKIADKEEIKYEVDGLHIIAQKADGGLRDALSMFDQIVSFSNRNVTYQATIDNLNILDYDYYFKLMDSLAKEDAAEALLVFDTILNSGFDGAHFIAGLSNHIRNLLVIKEPKTLVLLDVSETIKKRYLEQSSILSTGLLLSALNIANQAEVSYKTSKNQRLQIELALLKMCHLSSAIKLGVNGIPQSSIDQKKKLTESVRTPVSSPISTYSGIPSSNAITSKTALPLNEVSTLSSQTVNNKAPEVVAEKKTFSSGKGWGSIKSSVALPSLDTVLEDRKVEEDNENKLVQGNTYREVTFNSLIGKWNHIAEEMKKSNRITLYTLMTSNVPRLQGNIIEIDVENAVQSEQMKEGKIDILNYLRQELQNFSLDIETKQIEQSATRKPYTAQEKYQVMAAKNPALETLRKTFNLGLS